MSRWAAGSVAACNPAPVSVGHGAQRSNGGFSFRQQSRLVLDVADRDYRCCGDAPAGVGCVGEHVAPASAEVEGVAVELASSGGVEVECLELLHGGDAEQ